MKRLLLFASALLILLTACSLDSTIGELIDPNYRDDKPSVTTITESPLTVYNGSVPEIPDRLKYLFERMDDYEVLGITTEYLEDYLNELDFDLMEEDIFKWVRQKYEEMCEAEGRVPQVTYFPFILSGVRNIEAFYGPEIKSNVNNVVVGDNIYTAEWVYRHTIEDYEAAGITPEMLEEKIYYYQGFPFNAGVAQPFFERKLSAYLGHEVSLDLEEERIPGKEYGVIYEMPRPFPEIDGTEFPEYWRYPVDEEQLHIPAYLVELVPREDFDDWFDSFGAFNTIENPTVNDFPNVVSFVRYFDYITDDDILTAYEDPFYNQNDHDKIWYDKLAQTLTVRNDYDNVYVNMYIGAYAIVVDDKYIYTPEWVYNHSIAEWEMAGITPELITEKLGYYDDYNYTDEARAAFEYKLKRFLGYDISLDKKQNFSAMVVNGVTYDLEWLSTHTIQDYRAESITIDHLKSFLDYIQPYWGDSKEYEWIESAYLRMCEDAGIK